MNDLQKQIIRIHEAKRFFDLLYGGVKKTAYGYLWTLPDKKTYPFDVSNSSNRQAMAEKAIELNDKQKRNVYFGVCLTSKALPEYQRINSKNPAVLISALWVDLDIAGTSHASDNLPPDEKTALSFLPFKPSVVVHTGGGLHAYSLLDEPLELKTVEESDLAQALNTGYQSMTRKNANGYNVDPTHNLNWVLRVPGTYNRKFKNNPPLCVLQEISDIRYSINELDDLIVVPVEPKKDVRADSFSDNPDYDWARAVKMLDDIDGTTNPVWFRVRLNLKSVSLQCGVDDETAFNVFHTWSKKFKKTYKGEEDCRKEWDRTDTRGDANSMGTLVNEAGWNKEGRNREKAQSFWKDWKAKAEQHYKNLRAKKAAENMKQDKQKESPENTKFVLQADYFANNYDGESATIREYAKRNTGFETLDSKQPLPPALIVIGAEPGIGKTTFCYQLAEQIVSNNENEFAIYVSYEMSRLELFAKTLTRRTKLANDKAKQNGGKQDYPLDSFSAQQGKIPEITKHIIEEMKRQPLNFGVYEATSEDKIDNLLNTLETLIAKQKNPAIKSPVVVLDYLQIIPHDKDNHKLGIDGIILKLKEFQRKTKTTFIVISSINRSSYYNGENEPSLAAFKESGSIEFTADVAWLLTRDKTKENTPYKVNLICLKNRFGITGYKINFDFYAAENLFVDSLADSGFSDEEA